MVKFLVIQTAFIGDVVLATPLIEAMANNYGDAQIDFLVRKGNESLLANNPHLNKVLVWNKKKSKYKELLTITKQVRKVKYDYLINLQRFASTGFITAFSKAKTSIGFAKNPFSFLFTTRVKHSIGNSMHEIDRNLLLLKSITSNQSYKPKLYPSAEDYKTSKVYKVKSYVCMAPTSVWYTKQLPMEQWKKLIAKLHAVHKIYLLGAPGDKDVCDTLTTNHKVENLCGKLNFLQSAALMRDAQMNYVNDSAPLHFATAVNAPVTAFFCSTVPDFGFGPLSDNSVIAEIKEKLPCRPCGLHGKKTCPEKHFDCGYKIDVEKYAKV